jgi:hypothetical protein
MVAGHEIYSFLDGFSCYPKRQVQYCFHYRFKNICLDNHAFWIEECSTNLPVNNEYGIS